jgi:hypothetical protein
MDAEIAQELAGLKTRVKSVEEWMEAFKLQMTNAVNEIQANTAITEQTQGRTEEIYDFLAPARNFFRALGAISNFGLRVGKGFVRVLEFLGRLSTPVAWIVALCIAAIAYMKTGHWEMPEWWGWFLR